MKGFSIIELVMVVVVVAIAGTAIGSAYAYLSRSLALNQDLQRGAQIAQECAEHIVGRARKPGTYASVPTGATACNAIAVAAPYSRTVAVADIAAVGTLCTVANGCKSVSITVQNGAVTLVTLNFMLVNY
jgi:prepilin-type N-terminal cleavage/methylation domain-containing protein